MRDAGADRADQDRPALAGEFRANGSVRNQDGFYDAFDVKPGDKMYLPPGAARAHLVMRRAGPYMAGCRRPVGGGPVRGNASAIAAAASPSASEPMYIQA